MYNIYLADIANAIGSDSRRVEVKAFLNAYFDPIVKKAGIDGGAMVSFVTDDPKPKDNELLVYFTTSWHVVSMIEGTKPWSGSDGGMTLWNGHVTGSDVVADDKSDTRTIANLVFHELLHNKLHKGEELHQLDGLAGATVDAAGRPSASNIALMSAALKQPRKQWTGGFQAMKDRHKPLEP